MNTAQNILLIERMSLKTETQMKLWVKGLFEENPLIPSVLINGEADDKLYYVTKIWEQERIYIEKYDLFIKSFFSQFELSIYEKKPNNEVLNRYIIFLSIAPLNFRVKGYSYLVTYIIDPSNPLQNVIYGEDRNLYLALLNVLIDWSPDTTHERLFKKNRTLESFLFDNIDVWENSGYMQVALKYFIKYNPDKYAIFLNRGDFVFENDTDYERLIYSFEMFYQKNNDKAFIEIYNWLMKTEYSMPMLIKKIKAWIDSKPTALDLLRFEISRLNAFINHEIDDEKERIINIGADNGDVLTELWAFLSQSA